MILFFDGDCATCGVAGAEAGAGGIGGAAGAGAGAAGAGVGIPGGLLAAGGAGAAGLSGGAGAAGLSGGAGAAGLSGLGNPLVGHIHSVLTPPGILSELALSDTFSLLAEGEQGVPMTGQVGPNIDAADLDVEDLLNDDGDPLIGDYLPALVGLPADEGDRSLTGITDSTFTGGSQEVLTTCNASAQATSAPEPSSLLVWLLGVAGVAGVRRRRGI